MKGTPIMTLGTHEIKGKIEMLKNPFAILKKETGSEAMSTSEVTYAVSGMVKKKLLFNQYPKTIMRS